MGRKDRGSKKGDWREDETPAAFHNPFAALAGRTADEPGPQDVVEPVSVEVDSPAVPTRAVVRLEKKGRGGKRVTTVQHLDLDAATLATWCKELRTQLGCGGQVEDDTLVLHGDQRDRLIRALEERGVRRVTRG